jgi:hypothetical protein
MFDTIAPPRPKMPIVSRVLFESGYYNACLTRAGIIVQRNTTGTGSCLPMSHKQFSDYLAAFDDVVDADEGNALCKALLSNC